MVRAPSTGSSSKAVSGSSIEQARQISACAVNVTSRRGNDMHPVAGAVAGSLMDIVRHKVKEQVVQECVNSPLHVIIVLLSIIQ